MNMIQRKDEEARKIQFSGKSSYMIALPKKWVEELGLGQGDEVIITRQSDGSLLISPRRALISEGRGEVTIELPQKDDVGPIIRELVSLYVVGYNIIHVRAKGGKLTSTQREIIKEATRRHLIGTEVVADSTEEVTLQVLLSYPQLSVESALRRMFLIATSMHRDAVEALKKLDKDSAEGVIKTDDEVDRFSLYVIRQLKMAVQNDRILKEIGLATRKDCLGFRLIVKSVERTADHACSIARCVLTIKEPLDEATLAKIVELSEVAVKLFEESGSSLFKRDYKMADQLVDEAKLLAEKHKEAVAMMEKMRDVEPYHTLRLIVDDIRRTAEYASDIAEIVLNLTVDQVVIEAPH